LALKDISAIVNPKVYIYASGATDTYMPSWSTTLYTNSESTGCPVSECVLMDATCSSTPAINTNFYITAGGTGGTPWALTANKGVEDGWTQTFCYQCKGTSLGATNTAFSKNIMTGYVVR
jgi:hypothetical protein